MDNIKPTETKLRIGEVVQFGNMYYKVNENHELEVLMTIPKQKRLWLWDKVNIAGKVYSVHPDAELKLVEESFDES